MNSTKRATGLHLLAIHLSVFFLLVICFSLMPLTVFAQDSVADENAILVAETQKQLEQAREKFLAELATHADNVESFLQRREETVRRTGDLKLVEKAKTERRQFTETGKIPADLPERIKTAPRLARNRLEMAYSNAVKNYVRVGLDREAAALEKEQNALLKTPVELSAKVKSEQISLFNATDLTGWQKHPNDPSRWTVDNGQLVGRGKTGYLFTDRGNFSDFVLRAEVFVSSGENGGVFLRCPMRDERPPGYEIDLNSPHRGTIESGSIRIYPANGSGFAAKIVEQPAHKADEWFTLEISAISNEISVKINGNVISSYTDQARHFSKGHLSLQHYVEGKEIRFRRIEIQEITPKGTNPY